MRLHPQAHSMNALEGQSLVTLIHEGETWAKCLAVFSPWSGVSQFVCLPLENV